MNCTAALWEGIIPHEKKSTADGFAAGVGRENAFITNWIVSPCAGMDAAELVEVPNNNEDEAVARYVKTRKLLERYMGIDRKSIA